MRKMTKPGQQGQTRMHTERPPKIAFAAIGTSIQGGAKMKCLPIALLAFILVIAPPMVRAGVACAGGFRQRIAFADAAA